MMWFTIVNEFSQSAL